jgi:transketolase
LEGETPAEVPIVLPDGETIFVPVIYGHDYAACIKEAGDDPDVTNGIEVRASVKEGEFEILGGEGLKVRVVSMISPALFMAQDKAYRDSIIAPWTPVFAKSSGLPLLFAQIVGGFGKVSGLERFGASAPAGVLEKEFGYTPEAVAAAAKEYLAEFKANVEAFKKANA